MPRRSIHRLFRRRVWKAALLSLALLALACACSRSGGQVAPTEQAGAMTIRLSSPAFAEGAPIPTRYTCDGENISPPLKWSNVPPGTKSIALIADDPDAPAGTWVHWVMYNIPPATTELPEALPTTEVILNQVRQGVTDFKRSGYGGPCPPGGSSHRYFFRLYALDTELQLQPGATQQDLVGAIQGHILAQGQLMGTYQRK